MQRCSCAAGDQHGWRLGFPSTDCMRRFHRGQSNRQACWPRALTRPGLGTTEEASKLASVLATPLPQCARSTRCCPPLRNIEAPCHGALMRGLVRSRWTALVRRQRCSMHSPCVESPHSPQPSPVGETGCSEPGCPALTGLKVTGLWDILTGYNPLIRSRPWRGVLATEPQAPA